MTDIANHTVTLPMKDYNELVRNARPRLSNSDLRNQIVDLWMRRVKAVTAKSFIGDLRLHQELVILLEQAINEALP